MGRRGSQLPSSASAAGALKKPPPMKRHASDLTWRIGAAAIPKSPSSAVAPAPIASSACKEIVVSAVDISGTTHVAPAGDKELCLVNGSDG